MKNINDLITIFSIEFHDDWLKSNTFRLDTIILFRFDNNYYYYDVKLKQWNNNNFIELINKKLKLICCQPKQYVFRGTYLGDYLNTFFVDELTTLDFNFLVPKYEYIVEQAIKLNLPFILQAFRENTNNCIKNTNKQSLIKAIELNKDQLSIFQDYCQISKNDIMYYFNRLFKLNSSYKGIQNNLFKKICTIIFNDFVSNNELNLYSEFININNLTQKIEKIQNYIDNNFYEYYLNWLILKDLNQLDNHCFPQFPKPDQLKKLILEINKKVIFYQNKEYYDKLNEKYNKLIYNLKNFEFSNNKYAILTPSCIQDLDIEGNKLHHCVGSYKSSVANGNEIILFLRKVNDLTTPFYTINLDNEGNIRQIHSKYNSNIDTDLESQELLNFLNDWAMNKPNLINSKTIQSHYKLLNHL